GNVLDGVLDTDRTHQVKAQGLYAFKWGSSVGINAYLMSGTPITRQVPIIAPDNYPIRYLGRGSEGRTPVFSQADLFVAHTIKMGGRRSLELSANVKTFSTNAGSSTGSGRCGAPVQFRSAPATTPRR